jgi:hypothetical protein
MRPAPSRKSWLIVLSIGLLLGGSALLWFTRPPGDVSAVAADRIDPANEGRLVRINGVVVAQPVRDTQLGVSTDAIALLRKVEMRQWQETCVPAGCDYELVWSVVPIDSRGFREAGGHVNPGALPFPSERFLSGDVRLGAFGIDPALAAGEVEPVAHAVGVADLPPNLAASFRVQDGVLLTGEEAQEAAAGDLRVSYTIVPAGERNLIGVQEGSRLRPPRD